MPGGVSSPDRSFEAVGGTPRFIEQGQGSRLFDADKLQYIDCVGSWGPLILGHGHRYVVEAVKRAAGRGFTFGAPTKEETDLCDVIVGAVPGIEMVRLVSSGTEATMCALRLARAVTGRKTILKFDGGYHGHVDSLLIKHGSGGAAKGVPDSDGVPSEFTAFTMSAPYNNLAAARKAFQNAKGDMAAVIVEPVAVNRGCVPPADGFLSGLRALCDEHSSLLIFDEVVTGFRVAWGGAQQRYGVTPDITTLGKIIGGGLPIGAFGASREIMSRVAPEGATFQSGTYSGNPIAVAAGLSTLSILRNSPVYKELETKSSEFEEGVLRIASKYRVPVVLNRVGSIWTMYFSDHAVTDHYGGTRSDSNRYAQFFHSMLDEGVYLPPSQHRSAFFSAAPARKDIQQIIERIDVVFKKLAWEMED